MLSRFRLIVLGSGAILSSFSLAAEQHKLILPSDLDPPAGYSLLAEYGDFRLFEGSGAIDRLDVTRVLENPNVLLFDRQPFDTQRGRLSPPIGFQPSSPSGAALQIVQFIGPIKSEWLDALRAAGAQPVHYVANYGYLVWADDAARRRLQTLADERAMLQFSAPLPSFLKLDPHLTEAFASGRSRSERFDVMVQRYRAPNDGRAAIDALGAKQQSDWSPMMAFESAAFSASLDEIRAIVELPDVNWVEQVLPRHLLDEVQAQIVRGHFNSDQSGPAGEGYREWLLSRGFPTTPGSYPIVDVTDDGVGNRTVNTGDPTLHEGGSIANPTRVIYNQTCTSSDPAVGGHGHINASIIGGFDVRTNADTPGARFPANYQRGLGINPWTRLGSTRIFAPAFNTSACGGNDVGVIRKVQEGSATISSNSWGCSSCAGTYDIGSQSYDAGTRDANPSLAGHQPITFVFSAGNSGPSSATVGTPGNAKNVITVGASENARPVDENGNWTDGCNIGPTGADNAMDVIGFSSRGPAPGGRVKPEVIAPGTHITGTRADPSTGNAVCDASRPVGNATYAASSGTSHSAPAVAGVVSLVHYWIGNDRGALQFESGQAGTPSPALDKAWLMAHPTYLTGVGANDTLPSNVQGYGMPNLELMFSDTPKFIVDQSVVFTESWEVWTWEGGVANPGEPVRITLAWTDQPGAVGTSPQVNDLDLVVVADGETYLGNRFNGAWSVTGGSPDTANNYEAVFFPPGAVSVLEISVMASNIAGDGVPGNDDSTDQDFALVCSNCTSEPGFAILIAEPEVSVCTLDSNEIDLEIEVRSILGFDKPVTLVATNTPPGSVPAFSANPVAPPGESVLSLTNLSAVPAGGYEVMVAGVSGPLQQQRSLALSLFTGLPAAAALATPSEGALDQPRRPSFTWSAASQAAGYLLEVATDPGFEDIVHSAAIADTSHTPAADLPSNSHLYWRVRTDNSCGARSSVIRSFRTETLPGECGLGLETLQHYFSDFDSGAADWTSGGLASTWALSTTRAYSPPNAFHAVNSPSVSDQLLVSPPLDLSAAGDNLVLVFWNYQHMERRTAGGCWDGGLLEISTDGGSSYVEVPNERMLTRAYDGPIAAGHSNPAIGRDAWCGDPRDWERMVVDLSPWAGTTARLRFRLATDASVGREGWYIDDLSVHSCVIDDLFADRFE